MSTIVLTLAGNDITANVLFASAHFESSVNGVAGEAKFRFRDDTGTYSASVGAPVVLTVDGDVVWRGFLMQWTRTYVFPALNVTDFGPARFFDATCADINVLLSRRYVFDQSNGANITAPLLPAHTADTTAITELFADWLDLTGDGLDTTTLVENVGDTTWTQAGRAWEGSDSWAQAMQSIANLPAAIYYIDPDKNFVYTDVDTPNAPFGLSDQPNGTTTKGYREMEILKDGTGLANDVMAWGAGYGSGAPVFDREIDATSQSDHGVWQLGQTTFGVYKQATIERIADSILLGSPDSKRGAKDDRVAVTCVTYEPGLRPAQKVPFTSNVFGFSDVIPIRKMEIDFPGPQTPKYSLTLSHEIDTPFGFFDPFNIGFSFHGPRLCPPGYLPGPLGNCIPIPLPGPVGCQCGITDSFHRVVASGLGTSDCGLTYSYSTSAADWSVDGTNAHSTSGSMFTVSAFLAFGRHLSTGGSITAQMTSSTGTPSASYIFFGLDATDGSEFVEMDIYVDGTATISNNSGAASTSLAFDATDPIRIRVGTDGTNALGKVWLASDPEPAGWTLTLAFTHPVGTFEDLFFGSFTDDTDTMTWGDLDIADINRCMPIGFDDFQRTVAANSWGIATPGGETWTEIASSNRTISVANSGIIQNGPVAAGSNSTISVSAVPFVAGADFAAIVKFFVTSDVHVLVAAFEFDGFSFEWNAVTGGSELVLDGGGGRVTTSFDASFWANLIGSTAIFKAERIGATAHIKLWDSALVEPGSWMLTGTASYSTPTYRGFVSGILHNQTGGVGVQQIEVASIDFDYFDKPCYFVAGTTVFDDFNRVTDAGNTPYTIGDASLNPAYAYTPAFGGGFGPSGLLGTDGANLFATSGWNFITSAPGFHDGTDPWAPPVFTLRTRFNITTTPVAASNIGGLFIIGFSNVNLALHLDDRTWDPMGLFGGALEIGTGPTTVPGTYVFPKNDWVGGTWYIAELLHDVPNNTTSARVYPEGTTVPAWQITRPAAGTLTASDISLLIDTYGSGHTGGWQIQSDYVEFIIPSTQPVSPATGIAANTWVCESFDVVTTTITTERKFLALSPQVWLNNGLLPLSDYTADPVAGTITFGSTPGPSSTARVCYWALP